MKKYIPILMVLPLLAGCGGKVKAPKFADLGSEKQFSEFQTNFNETKNKSAWQNVEKNLPSAVLTSKESKKEKTEILRGKKSIYSSEEGAKTEKKASVDMKAVVLTETEKESSYETSKEADYSISSKTNKNVKNTYQEYKGSKNTYLIKVDEKEKAYKSEEVLGKDDKIANVLNMFVVEMIADETAGISDAFSNYGYSDEETKKGYKFYQNGKIFTIVFEKKIENKEYKVDDKVQYTTTTTYSRKWQVDFTDGNMAYREYRHDTSERKYAVDTKTSGEYVNVVKDDIRKYETESAVEVLYKYDEKVSLKKVDLAKFAALQKFE